MSEIRRGRFMPKGAPVRRRLGYDDAEAGPSGLQPPIHPAASSRSPTHPIVQTPKKKGNVFSTIKKVNSNLDDGRIQELLQRFDENPELLQGQRRDSDASSLSDIAPDESGDEEYFPPGARGQGKRKRRGSDAQRPEFGGFGGDEGEEGELERFTSASEVSEESEESDNGESDEGQSEGDGRGGPRARGRTRGRARGGRASLRTSVSADADDGWSEDPNPPAAIPFTATPGLTVQLPSTPLAFLQLFLTRELLEYLMYETSDYATYMRHDLRRTLSYAWNGCTLSDIAKYLGLLLMFGLMPAPDLRTYWRAGTILLMPRVPATMSRRRFLALNRYFHAFNRRAVPRGNRDRLLLVRPVMEYLQSRCRALVVPSQNLSLDEGTLPYKGALSLKVYNPQKPKKYGIKFFFLTESTTGYVVDFSIYTGVYSSLKDTVYGLVGRLRGHGYHLFMDNYYNSVSLAQDLYDNGIHCSGTLRLVRGAPRVLKDIGKRRNALPRGDMTFRKKGDVFVILWQGVRLVPMITTSHEPVTEEHEEVRRHRVGGTVRYERTQVQRPTIIGHYTRHMGGVDLFDQLMQYYSFARRSNRWTHKLLLYLLQVGIQNAYILYIGYSTDRKKLTHAEFLELAAYHLLEFDEDEWPYCGDAIARVPHLPEAERALHILQANQPAGVDEGEDADDPVPFESASPASGTTSPAAAPTATPPAAAPTATPPAAAPTATPPADIPTPVQPSRRVVDPAVRLLPGDHSLERIPENRQRRCRVCHVSGTRKDTRFVCVTCQIPLCRNDVCPHKYHTLQTFWTSPPVGTVEGHRSRVRGRRE